jgi:formylglycine-generating enzyme required for sulfatase activity
MSDSIDLSDLLISLVRQSNGQYLVELRFTQAGAQTEHTPQRATAIFDEPTLQNLRQTILSPEKHGRFLRQALFEKPNLSGDMRQYLAKASDKLRLRVEIDPSARELVDIRWETLRDLDDTDFLAVNANHPFSRFLSSTDWEDYILRPSENLRALIVVANPIELSQDQSYSLSDPVTHTIFSMGIVDVKGEVARAQEALAGLGKGNITILADYPGSQGRATYAQITDQLQRNCDILYLVCHGALLTDIDDQRQMPFLLLEKDDGTAERVKGENLARYIHNLPVERRPRLAVLASCQSGGQGKVPASAKDPGETNEDERSYDHGALVALGPRLVEAGLPAVVAMQDNIEMETVKQFMPAFFQALLADPKGRVDQALAAARNQVYAAHSPDWWVPVLYLRLTDGQMFLPQPAEIKQPGEPETIAIPGGFFKMGREPGPGIPAYETPPGQIYLPDYRIGKYSVTNKEFARFIHQLHRPVPPELGWDGLNPPKGQEDHPVRGVTWFEALEYCHWLCDQTGKKYSLPSEAQWERAARGEDGRLYPWGNEWLPGRCNQGSVQTAIVGAFPPQNESGLYDLVGNILQWTTTLWGEKRQQPDPDYAYPWQDDGRDDLQANRQIRRILRGSSYSDLPQECACTARRSFLPDDRGLPGKRHGFRIVINR